MQVRRLPRPPAGTSRSIAAWQFQKEGGGHGPSTAPLAFALGCAFEHGAIHRTTVGFPAALAAIQGLALRAIPVLLRGTPAIPVPPADAAGELTHRVFLEAGRSPTRMSWPVRPARGHGPGLWTAPAGLICRRGDSCYAHDRAVGRPDGHGLLPAPRPHAGPQEATPAWGVQGVPESWRRSAGTALIHVLTGSCACGCFLGGALSLRKLGPWRHGRGLHPMLTRNSRRTLRWGTSPRFACWTCCCWPADAKRLRLWPLGPKERGSAVLAAGAGTSATAGGTSPFSFTGGRRCGSQLQREPSCHCCGLSDLCGRG